MFIYANFISGNILEELVMLIASGEKNWMTEGQRIVLGFFPVCMDYLRFGSFKMFYLDSASVHWHVKSWLHYSIIATVVCNVASSNLQTPG